MKSRAIRDEVLVDLIDRSYGMIAAEQRTGQDPSQLRRQYAAAKARGVRAKDPEQSPCTKWASASTALTDLPFRPVHRRGEWQIEVVA